MDLVLEQWKVLPRLQCGDDLHWEPHPLGERGGRKVSVGLKGHLDPREQCQCKWLWIWCVGVENEQVAVVYGLRILAVLKDCLPSGQFHFVLQMGAFADTC